MAESPDFEKIAQIVVDLVDPDLELGDDHDANRRCVLIVEVSAILGQQWNARGAADIARLDTELSTLMGPTAAGPYVKNLDRALRKLDR